MIAVGVLLMPIVFYYEWALSNDDRELAIAVVATLLCAAAIAVRGSRLLRAAFIGAVVLIAIAIDFA
jgi:hypothetical protein